MFHRARSSLAPILLIALAGLGVARIATGEPGQIALSVPGGAVPELTATPAKATAAVARRGGDAALRGELDLAAATLEGDRYVVKLADGRRAVLTLEPKVQRAAERVLAQARAPIGAVVVMATDGRLLALAGRTHGEGGRERAPELATTTWAPAASIFKLVTAAALVEDGVGKGDRVCFHGGLRAIDATNLRDDRRDDRCETLGFAVAESQNAIIAKLAARHLDGDEIGRAARALGFGGVPDFALATEPSRFTVPADPLEFARMSAGFWSSELSPLGGALLANTLATGGLAVTPRIVAEIIDGDRRVKIAPAKSRRTLPARIAAEVGRMMIATTRTGTAAKGFVDRRGRRLLSVDVAGKTGSLVAAKPYRAYSWFVGFAPADEPEVAIAVILGNPESWYLKAHTGARLVLDELY